MKARILPFFCALLTYFATTLGLKALSPSPDGGYPGGNTAEGQNALFSLATGGYNTAVGFFSLRSNTSNSFNTAVGAGALLANVADENTAVGAVALLSNTIGSGNTADGAMALFSNTTGVDNTGIGQTALAANTVGFVNTAVGQNALAANTTGSANTAVGVSALLNNTASSQNTALGTFALEGNNTGAGNTAVGYSALLANATSDQNTAVGINALLNSTGTGNTAVGYQSLQLLVNGSYNIALAGGGNLTSGDFNIDIGNDGVDGDSGVIRIGSGCCQTNTFIAGIWGVTASGGAAVYVNEDGQLGTATSSARFKKDIASMENASEVILSLRPVTFHYKTDTEGTPQFGLIAEEVEKIDRDLVVRDKEGKPYTVRYDAVNAMLLNEFLKEHRKVESLEKTIAEQQKENADIRAMLKEQAAQIQKVSVQLELSTAAPQTVLNNR